MDARQLAALRDALAGWIEESRTHGEPFGEPTTDGRPRFDVAPEHTAQAPALRRVNNPSEIDDAYMEVMRNSAMTDMVAAPRRPRHEGTTTARSTSSCPARTPRSAITRTSRTRRTPTTTS